MKFWLGVVQREHVLRGVAMGIAQTSHGSPSGIKRMSPGDGMVYYSPKTAYPDGDPLKRFTAIGIVSDADPWQADEGTFQPWRRRIDWVEGVVEAPIAPLLGVLNLSTLDGGQPNSNWGYQLRRGQLELTEHDFRIIAAAMGADTLAG